MAHHHERQVCGGCGAVIMQCRCMEPKVDRVVCDTCKNCNVATSHPYPGRPAPGVPVMAPVSEEDLEKLRTAEDRDACTGGTQDRIDAVIAEFRALRAVADAAERWAGAPTETDRLSAAEKDLLAALRAAGRGSP